MKEKKVLRNAEIIETMLWLKKPNVLVLADLHLGFEEAIMKQGTLLPRQNFEEIKKVFERVFARQKRFERIVINGDLKHEFGIPTEQEWKETIALLELLQKHCAEIVLVQGNHDNILGPIATWKNIKILKNGLFLEKEKIFVLHGHKIPESIEFERAKTIIIGHDHVAVTLRDGAKRETFKCFLKGKSNGKTVIALPSTSPIVLGTNVLQGKLLSLFLQGNLLDWDCWIVEDKVYYFGKLKNIIALG